MRFIILYIGMETVAKRHILLVHITLYNNGGLKWLYFQVLFILNTYIGPSRLDLLWRLKKGSFFSGVTIRSSHHCTEQKQCTRWHAPIGTTQMWGMLGAGWRQFNACPVKQSKREVLFFFIFLNGYNIRTKFWFEERNKCQLHNFSSKLLSGRCL
jgi:hypothetical protein